MCGQGKATTRISLDAAVLGDMTHADAAILCEQCAVSDILNARADLGHAPPPKMQKNVQHDTETTQCWCVLQ